MRPSQTSQNILTPLVIDLVTVTAQYCRQLEKLAFSHATVTKKEWMSQLTKIIPLIYVKAALLAEDQANDDVDSLDAPAATVTEDDYEQIRTAVWRLLGSDDDYLVAYSPDEPQSDTPLAHTLSEDLADVYQDAKDFVAVFAREEADDTLRAALATFSTHFTQFLGALLLRVMPPLHQSLYHNLNDEDHADRQPTEDDF